MTEIIRVEDQFYILATSSLADDRTRVLKHGETFGVFDRYGDVQPIGIGAQGLYHEGTRHVSRLVLRLGPDRPLLLSSSVSDDDTMLTADMTNLDVRRDGDLVLSRGTVHLLRWRFIWEATCFEKLKVRCYGDEPVGFRLALEVDSDFADIFEVRGARRDRRGTLLPPQTVDGSIVLSYRGLDDVVRTTRVVCTPTPTSVSGNVMLLEMTLQPKEERTHIIQFTCLTSPGAGKSAEPMEIHDDAPSPAIGFDETLSTARRFFGSARTRDCTVVTPNEHFNEWLTRSVADLTMMETATEHGPYPYAGVPWFSAPFGRDGIITALEMLWVNPELARGVLGFLASTQAATSDPAHDAEPGKILHESRLGEMAALEEIPFGRYYGSVDSTPLFVVLAAAYYTRTADRDLVEEIWPSVDRALAWIDGPGDPDQDGFVEYLRHSDRGLLHQGWKDSSDAVFHEDGSPAEGPIALSEVQGYVYAAKLGAAQLASLLGLEERADQLIRQAKKLQERFEEAFWCEDIETYAMALDGAKRPCRVRTSNAGHCLFAGISSKERALRTARTLMSEESYSGWGIRTLAASEPRYNPMSYHNGSVWPHDNAIVACGLARYGFREDALSVLAGLYDASLLLDLHRLPELFCGFPRRVGEGPTLYPVACSPQAWAAGSVFLLLQACLGLTIDAPEGKLEFVRPHLPSFLREVRIENLRVGSRKIDLMLHRYEGDVGIDVLRREGDLQVVSIK